MSEVNIKYNGSSIATMNESGTKTLLTAGKYCPADFQVEYNRPTIPDLPAEYVIGLVRDANDNYAFTDLFAGITAAYESGQTLLVVPDDTLTNVFVESVEYIEAPDPDTHPEDAGLQVTIRESESTMIPVPTPDDGTTTVENMRYSYYVIDLFYDDTVEVSPTGVYYLVNGITAGTEAQPSDVPAGLLFINSNGIQVGTAT